MATPPAPAPGAGSSPAPSQYLVAPWSVPAGSSETIVSLQTLGVGAAYLAIYRVNNSTDSSPVTVQTDQAKFELQPGTSIDVSTQTITLLSQNQHGRGTYQIICCSTVSSQITQQTKPVNTSSLFVDTFDPITFLNGGGGNGGGGNGGGPFDPLTFPE